MVSRDRTTHVHVRRRCAPARHAPRPGAPAGRGPRSPRRAAATLLAGAALASACGGADVPPATGTLAFGVPGPVLSARDVDRSALGLDATIDGEPVEVERTATGWTVRTNVPEGEAVAVEVRWFETIDGEKVVLAAWSRELEPLRAARTIEVRADELDTASFDDDGDEVSNLAELQAGSDPLAAETSAVDAPDDASAADQVEVGPPDGAPDGAPDEVPGDAPDESPIEPLVTGPAPGEDPALDVRIPFVDPEAAGSIVIDGIFEDVWTGAIFETVDGERLWLNRLLLIDDDNAHDPTLQDGVPEYFWFALHDGAYLYLFVQSEYAENGPQTPYRDSPPGPWFDDDAVSVLIDANRSREESLQGDDVYFAYPLVELDGEERRPLYDLPLALPAPPGLEYAACACIGYRSGWEMKIPLAEVALVPGQEFGLELQIHEDLDGGDRDALYGWAGPPIGNQDEDFGFESPALLGTVVLAPPPE